MALDPSQDWKTAKDEYFKLTGEKKPREKVIGFFNNSHTGLSKLIEEITDGWEKRKLKDKSWRAYQTLLEKFTSAADKYIATLDKLIDEEAKKTTEWAGIKDNKAVVERAKTDMYKGLKMLKAKLENYKAVFTLKGHLIGKADSQASKVQKLESQFILLLTSGLSRFKAAAKSIAATPTVDVYNREFRQQDAVRSLTTALGTFRAIEKEYAQLKKLAEDQNDASAVAEMSASQQRNLEKAKVWLEKLEPWASGSKWELDAKSTKEQVLASLKEAAAIVKACAADYGQSI